MNCPIKEGEGTKEQRLTQSETIEVVAIAKDVSQGAMEEAMEMAKVVAMEDSKEAGASTSTSPIPCLENNTKEVNILIQVS